MVIGGFKGPMVNLALVRTIEELPTDAAYLGRTRFTFADGHVECLQIKTRHVELAMCPVIKADPGFELLTFGYPPDGDPDTHDIAAGIMRDPVIAWRLEHPYGEPAPITPDMSISSDPFETTDESSEVAIQWPNGSIHEPQVGAWATLDSWVGCIRGRWRDRIEEKAKKLEAAE